MCGIFGYIGPESNRAALLAQALAIHDEQRGRHSTGYVARFKNDVRLVKKALRGAQFVAERHMAPLFGKGWTLLLGHNRWATAGAITDRNSHPFRLRMCDGSAAYAVHNGCVPAAELAARFGVKTADVDSETYFRAIAARSGRTVPSFLGAVREVTQVAVRGGDMAVLWMFPRSRSIFAWRSSNRPLVVFDARSVGLGRWFCSERDIFRAAWASLGGAMPAPGKVRFFTARPGAIYRTRDDGTYEVDIVGDLGIERAPQQSRYFPRQHERRGDLLFDLLPREPIGFDERPEASDEQEAA